MAGRPRKIAKSTPIDLWSKVFADLSGKEAFDTITGRGVPAEQLKAAVCDVWMAASFPRRIDIFHRRRGAQSRMRRLFKRIEEFAKEIQRLHEDHLFNPKVWSSNFNLINEIPPGPSQVLMERDLCELPNMLRLQAKYLQFQFTTIQKALAYRREQHSETKAILELLNLVRDKVGQPLYPQIADLLTAAYQAFEIPKTVHPETLSILYTRHKRHKPA